MGNGNEYEVADHLASAQGVAGTVLHGRGVDDHLVAARGQGGIGELHERVIGPELDADRGYDGARRIQEFECLVGHGAGRQWFREANTKALHACGKLHAVCR